MKYEQEYKADRVLVSSKLHEIANMIRVDNLSAGGTKFKIPNELDLELEYEVSESKGKIEIEISWKGVAS